MTKQLRIDQEVAEKLLQAALYLNALRKPVFVPMEMVDKLAEQIQRAKLSDKLKSPAALDVTMEEIRTSVDRVNK